MRTEETDDAAAERLPSAHLRKQLLLAGREALVDFLAAVVEV